MSAIRLDRHLLHAGVSQRDVDALVAAASADRSSSQGIVVPPVFAKRAVEALRGSGVRVASVAGYPLGLGKPTIKAIEATSLAKDGVDAIELTPLLANMLDGNLDALRDELLEVVRGVRAARRATLVHVRLDVDVLGASTTALAEIASAIVRGACDGVVLEAESPQTLAALLPRWPTDPGLELKLCAAAGSQSLAHFQPTALGSPAPR